ncbi:MAG: iron-containing alcohol dehydrogenase [Spirochaetia bacterium]|jgi:alcohol dehydrogenase class IV|nr:iron-containing alcohol dehydrogenase [Spirochaetia bacterium]
MQELKIDIKGTILSGRGKIDRLSALMKPGCKRALLVRDPSTPEGIAAGIAVMLNKKGIDCVFYTDIKKRAVSSDAEILSDFIKKGYIQSVIALGGQITLNIARLAVASAESGFECDDILDGLKKPGNQTLIDYIEIPSSIRNPIMFTQLSAVADSRNRGIKIVDTGRFPSLIIKDASVFDSIPESSLSSIRFDLIFTAAEAICLRTRHFFTDTLLFSSLRKLLSEKDFSVDELSDIALCSDYAYSLHGPGSGYYLYRVLNSLSGVPSSYLTAILLPHFFEYYFSESPDIASAVVSCCSGSGNKENGENEESESFVNNIRKMIKKKNLPIRLSETGIRKEGINAAASLFASAPEIVKPPLNITVERVAAILKSAL